MNREKARQIGIAALAQKLGAVGMVRFLQQSETGRGDYTKKREQWPGDPELKYLFDAIKDSEAAEQNGCCRLGRPLCS